MGQPSAISWQLDYLFGLFYPIVPDSAKNHAINMRMVDVSSPFQTIDRLLNVTCQ